MLRGLRQAGGSILATLSLSAAVALADDPAAKNLPPGAKRVDQGVSDVNPLQNSLRVIRPQTRGAQNFSDLYEFTDRDGKKKYARMSGALTAVFSRSEYVQTSIGTLPLIPAGAVFRLGRLQGGEPAPERAAPNAVPSGVPTAATPGATTLVQTRLSPMTAPTGAPVRTQRSTERRTEALPPTAQHREEHVPSPGMLSDETYRRSRVRTLLALAAQPSARMPEASGESESGANPSTSAETAGTPVR